MPDNARQKASPAYRLPALDRDFILGDSTRGVRFLLEYQKAEDVLRAAAVESTIVVFGSARIRPDGPEKHRFWCEEARKFAHIASLEGGATGGPPHRRVIATGGGPGAMEAANRGASEAGAPSIGFNITLPHEQEPNAWSTPEFTFNFHYFAMRKMHLAMRATALVVFPGGFGTLDELFEIVTLRQTGKMPDAAIVLFDRAFWKRLIDFDFLVEQGMIAASDLALLTFADTAREAWDAIVSARGETSAAAARATAPPRSDPPGR